MSGTNEKKYSHERPDKDSVLAKLGDVITIREPLSLKEDRRILRKIDLKYVKCLFLNVVMELTSIAYSQSWDYRTCSSSSTHNQTTAIYHSA